MAPTGTHARASFRIARFTGFILLGSAALFILMLYNQSRISSEIVSQLPEPTAAPEPDPAPESTPAEEKESESARLWLTFAPLEGYYRGLRTLVSPKDNVPENGGKTVTVDQNGGLIDRPDFTTGLTKPEKPLMPAFSNFTKTDPPTPFNPLPEFDSDEYKTKHGPSKECFLDKNGKVKTPELLAYNGVPAGMPDPIVGSYSALGIRDDVCFDRVGRLGPYGLREVSLTEEKPVNDIDWTKVQWVDAQKRCLNRNENRFEKKDNPNRVPRTAIVLRTWAGYDYTSDDILNLRSIMSELVLQSRGQYSLHFLVEVKARIEAKNPIWIDSNAYHGVLDSALPEEFQGMGTLWSESQMKFLYPDLDESSYRDLPVYGPFRGSFLPIQYFAAKHPEYDYFWNWEMDVRYIGHLYHLLDKLDSWSTKQPRRELWERSSKFYVPSVHGTWDNFKELVKAETELLDKRPDESSSPGSGDESTQARRSIWGPNRPSNAADHFEPHLDSEPPHEKPEMDVEYKWGVGEPADLLTLMPFFDPVGTSWLLADDVTGFHSDKAAVPRRAAVTSTYRLSHRLLRKMSRETSLAGHTAFTEMWPATVALHHGLKAVAAPHPLFLDRAWPAELAEAVLNAGSSGSDPASSVFGETRHHAFIGASWYYHAAFAARLWRRWAGLEAIGVGAGAEEEAVVRVEAVLDRPGTLYSLSDLDELRVAPKELVTVLERARAGGLVWERKQVGRGPGGEEPPPTGGQGRMCVRSVLVHPVKRAGRLIVPSYPRKH